MLVDPSRFAATYHLTMFWELVPPWIETEDAPGTKVLPAGAHAHELAHWTITYRVWNGWQSDRFVGKRIAEMTDAEFLDWCRAGLPGFRAWMRWIKEGASA